MYQKLQPLVDMYSESDEISEGHVVLTYDIECEMTSGLPNPEELRMNLLLLHFMIQATNDYWVLVVDKEGLMVEKNR